MISRRLDRPAPRRDLPPRPRPATPSTVLDQPARGAATTAAGTRVDVATLGLIALLSAYLVLAAAYALIVPRWYAPDEPAHYNYARHIASTGTLPILQVGDFPAAYLDALKSAKPPFPREASIDWIRYEAHQPPLYYLLAALVLRLAGPLLGENDWLALRVFSILLGALTIVLGYLTARAIWPRSRLMALAVAAFPVAVPMHVAMSAAINNDTLAEVVLSALALALARGVIGGFTPRLTLLTGLLLGLALLTKLVDYVALGLVPAALLVRAWLEARGLVPAASGESGSTPATERGGRGAGRWAGWVARGVPQRLAAIYLVAALLAGWWFVRAMIVYGPLDPLGLVRHNAVMGEEPRTHQYVDLLGLRGALERFASTLAQSFWAQFGWMSILVDQRIYLLLNLLTALVLLGALLGAWRWWREGVALSPERKAALGVLLLVAAAVVATVVYYNLRFWQPQGRYLFPAIVPLGVLFALGLRELLNERHRPALFGLLLAGLIGLNGICLRLYIIPFFR